MIVEPELSALLLPNEYGGGVHRLTDGRAGAYRHGTAINGVATIVYDLAPNLPFESRVYTRTAELHIYNLTPC